MAHNLAIFPWTNGSDNVTSNERWVSDAGVTVKTLAGDESVSSSGGFYDFSSTISISHLLKQDRVLNRKNLCN